MTVTLTRIASTTPDVKVDTKVFVAGFVQIGVQLCGLVAGDELGTVNGHVPALMDKLNHAGGSLTRVKAVAHMLSNVVDKIILNGLNEVDVLH